MIRITHPIDFTKTNINSHLARAFIASRLDSANFPGSLDNSEAEIKPENTCNITRNDVERYETITLHIYQGKYKSNDRFVSL